MKEKGILKDVIGTEPPKEESKMGRYARIVFGFLGIGFIVLLVVMAVLRR